MDPFLIVTVVYTPSGPIIAYDEDGKVVSKLTESGLEQLKGLVGDYHLTVLDNRPPAFKMPNDPGGGHGSMWIPPVKAVATAHLDRLNLPDQIDGADIEHGDLLLLTGQHDPRWNGIHRVKTTPIGMVRCSMEPYEGAGLMTLVKEGDLYDSTVWYFDGKEWSQVED